ncbi:vacuolar membrane protein [Ophiostoma piceae UAMH 11346]|uniref:Vacuolar membrane protein n=1 Tax=Ophiostoma piceae (strain UAMH 11346) TaxID=1262450 RepID=S3BP06_OPHP1|nr:vacuolar membrane protein [Ophiostoma piceae UAMH 11346]
MTTDPPGAGIGRLRSNAPLLGAQPAAAVPTSGFRASIGLAGLGRRTIGIGMLMVTVFLWTASNFMASSILSDSTYNKPFFVVYLNTSMFALSLVPMSIKYVRAHGTRATRITLVKLLGDLRQDIVDWFAARARKSGGDAADDDDVTNKLLGEEGDILGAGASSTSRPRADLEIGDVDDSDDDDDTPAHAHMMASFVSVASSRHYLTHEKISLRETTWLSLEFCMLWFIANYLAVACLEHTSVASATIFTSLSSMFTLLFCALYGVEAFSLRKLAGVVSSVTGIVLVSSIDLSGKNDENRGNFPHKSAGEIALGDAMALLSAVVYGAYVTVMKQRVGHEDRVSMPLFFGLVGLFNVVLLWPGFILLHMTGLETFHLPPTAHVWTIILVNAASSLASDFTWAYAMLLTTPLVVTVGMSLTIPLSLIGEMFQYSKYSSGLYWVGAGTVVLSFLFVNHESHEPDEALLEDDA